MASEHDLDGDLLGTIFDFKGIPGTLQHTIDNQFQLSVIVGNKGDRIGRRSLDVLNSDFMDHHPESDKIIKSLHCWFFCSGAFKSHADLRGQGITVEDWRVYLGLGFEEGTHPELVNVVDTYPPPDLPDGISDEALEACEETGGSVYWKDQETPEWTRSVMEWEWKVEHSYLEALEDNTIFICFLPLQSRWRAGWEVEQLILHPGEVKPTDRKGQLCYLFTCGDFEVIDLDNNITHYFKSWECKKLTKEHYSVKNIGKKKTKILRIYKK